MKDFKIFGVTGYTVMSNYHLRDKNLSLKSKGMLSFMLSLPEEWDYSISGLAIALNVGRPTIRTVIEELKELEYLQIKKTRNEFGRYEYEYLVYYLPYPKWLEMSKLTSADLPDMVKPDLDEPDMDIDTQINTNKQIEKEDKVKPSKVIKKEEIVHHSLTEVLIKENYIKVDDSSSFYFDDLFESLLKDGHEYKNLIKYTNYILQKLKENNYEDEDGKKITNKYGYFKNAINSNIKKLELNNEELFDPDEYNWLNDFEL